MFIFNSKDGDDVDPEKLTVMELARKIEAGMLEEEVLEALELVITTEQYKKAVDGIEKFVFESGKTTEFDKDSLLSFRKGMFYGIALQTKITLEARNVKTKKSADGIGKANISDPDAANIARKYAFMFWAIEKAYENWTDDDWFKNLMKNAKVEEAPVTKKKPKK